MPWIRGADPFEALAAEFAAHPFVTIFTALPAFLFPMAVGVTASVITRRKNRRVESVADFSERQPDPVFRAARDGSLVEVAAATLALFARHQVEGAPSILGAAVRSGIVAGSVPRSGQVVWFDAMGRHYVVSRAPTANDEVNVDMTPPPADAANDAHPPSGATSAAS